MWLMNWPGIILTDSKKLHYSSCKIGICKPASDDNSPQETMELPLPDMRVYKYCGLYISTYLNRHSMTLPNVGEAYWFGDMISGWWVSVYYRIFKFPDTPECLYIWRGEGRASDLPLAWCRVCTMCCDVRFTTRLLWCRQHCPLIGQHTHVPRLLIGWIKGVTVKGSHWNHFKFSATL